VFAKPVVVIDLTYADRMRSKEIVSVANQVQQCYGRNRKAAAFRLAAKSDEERNKLVPPLELHLLGWRNAALSQVFAKHEGFDRWKLFKHEENNLTDVFEKDMIVVLSPESSNVLEIVDKDAVYVIGGVFS
jgi:Trm5-related predicted tRNA methylase